jgi:outer membrane protein assembly factor BamD (BamD/ComL family)
MDPEGTERWRLEGYLPKDEFRAFLEMGLARVEFMQKKFADAERRYADVVVHYPNSTYAPEAVYWMGVSRYSGSHDGTALGASAQELAKKYPDSQWAMRSLPWLPVKETAA